MPGIDGIEATRRLVATSPHIAVLVLSMYEDDESIFAALRAGARGYLLKGADRSEIVRAIRAVARGRGDLRAGDRPPADDLLRECAAGAVPSRPSRS